MAKTRNNSISPTADEMVANMVASLNFNVKLDHIVYVDLGIRPMDDDYTKFKTELIKQLGNDEFEKHIDRRYDKSVTKKPSKLSS